MEAHSCGGKAMTTPRQRAAKAIADSYFKLMDSPQTWETCSENFRKTRREDAALALAALAEPSEAMIEAIKSAWKTAHVSISDSGAVKIWQAAHAAMMAEKDTGE
jgi:hypothetical protein